MNVTISGMFTVGMVSSVTVGKRILGYIIRLLCRVSSSLDKLLETKLPPQDQILIKLVQRATEF